MDNNNYKRLQQTVRVEGKGQSKEHAMANALSKIQKKVNAELNGMIIRIEPMNIEIVSAIEEIYTERFLLFFFPRSRSQFQVVMDVTVDLFLVNIENIDFKKKQRG
ncbi:DUF4312 family protein [Heyndrickxia oleronia]|uniref:DUF4312 family protein n=1 Tax=Heyndrickxia oleronia TaxID=38875 RepID=UPI0015D2D0AD|nr:DUF4312 family protein [Heyndrickxia oleronia]MBU5214258.1 DUF4312 family protein [Heyndrickxia oleronia]NYV65179.1 DUF4312 family protein [Bacillus sp. Gen3]